MYYNNYSILLYYKFIHNFFLIQIERLGTKEANKILKSLIVQKYTTTIITGKKLIIGNKRFVIKVFLLFIVHSLEFSKIIYIIPS